MKVKATIIKNYYHNEISEDQTKQLIDELKKKIIEQINKEKNRS